MSSDFVFTLRVKPPKASSMFNGRQMIVVKSNVRIPNWALNSLETLCGSPFSKCQPPKASIFIERLRQNHVIILHVTPLWWTMAGERMLDILAFAPSNSRRHFPVRIVHEERFTCKATKIVEYPMV